jgi:aminomethyltransferase
MDWLNRQWAINPRRDEVSLKNLSDSFSAVAVQGPKAAGILDDCFAGRSKPSALRKNEIAEFSHDGQPAKVSRTGYTGEDGFEIVAENEVMAAIWNALLEAGQPMGLKPAGLGARDTLRTEVCYPLYGHELDETTTPIEAGLSYFVSLEKSDFNGRAIMAEQKAKGVAKKLVAFKMTGRAAPPRSGYPILCRGEKAGHVTSGTQSPSLGVGIGIGYVRSADAGVNNTIDVEIRGQRAPAVIVAKPIYRPAPSTKFKDQTKIP